jgi:hypothetical protein
VVLLLSDCRHTDEDPVAAGKLLPELVVLAPRDDSDQAEAFALAAGARVAVLGSLTDVPAVVNQVATR